MKRSNRERVSTRRRGEGREWSTKGRRGNCTLVKPRYPSLPPGSSRWLIDEGTIEPLSIGAATLVDGRQSSYTRTSSRWNRDPPMDVYKRGRGGEGRRISTWNSRRRTTMESTVDRARLKTACPLLYLAARCGDRVCSSVGRGKGRREEGRSAACSHGAETAALHLNDDKSRSFEDTGRMGYKRGKGGVQRPVDSQTGGRRPDQCASPRPNERKRRTAEPLMVGAKRGRGREGGRTSISPLLSPSTFIARR